MAGGNITRIVGGKHSIETDEWIVYTDKFTAYAGQGSHFTADGGTFLGNPKEAPPIHKYFKKGWWSSDKEGNKKITNSQIGDIVYFQVEMTEEFPSSSLKENPKTISFKLYEFDGYDYSLGLIYILGPRLIVKTKPTKDDKQKISYVSWEDKNKNGEIDKHEEFSKTAYNTVDAVGYRAVIRFELGKALRTNFYGLAAIKLFMSLSYDTDIDVDLPENEGAYLNVELYCCSAACREPWQDLVEFDPRKVASVATYIKYQNDNNSDFRSPKRRWEILLLSSAFGSKLNMDYYSVKITKLPTTRSIIFKQQSFKLSEKPTFPRKDVLFEKGEKELWTSNRLFEHVRKNLGFFLNKDIARFYSDSARDQDIWDSKSPITAVMVFGVNAINVNMPTMNKEVNVIFDDAAVICSSFTTEQQWIFSPIQNPKNGQHPVSGNRQFGLRQVGTHYEFYVRGADRLTGVLDSLGEKAAFVGADSLWKGFQSNLVDFINQNGGKAEIDDTKYEWKRCKWITK